MTRRLGSGEGGIVSWPVGGDGEVVGFEWQLSELQILGVLSPI